MRKDSVDNRPNETARREDISSHKQSFLVIAAAAATVALAQAYEYIFPLGRAWVYDYGAGLETIPVHVALVKEHVLGALLAPFVAGGVDRLSFFGSADSPLILSTWLFAFFTPPIANGLHMFLQCFVGNVFAGLLCRDRLQLGTPISIVAAILYGSFSYPVFGFLFNAALIPFFAWFLTVPQTRGWGALLLVGFAASLLTSLSQGFPFIALFIVLWMPIVANISLTGTLKTLLALTFGYCVGKLPTLMAILNSVTQSQRSGELRYDSLIDTPILYTESDFLYSDRHMWTYTQVVPAFFAFVCIQFLALAFIQSRRRNLEVSKTDRALFAAVLRLGIVYIILASGLLVPLRTLFLPAFPWLGSVNIVRTVTAPGALLNTLVVAYGLAIIQLAIRRRAFALIALGAGVAANFSWIIRHQWTVPTEYALLTLVLAAGLVTAIFWNWLQETKRLGSVLLHVPAAAMAVLPCVILAIFYACVAPKVLLAPLRVAPQSGFARYYIPAIPEIESQDFTLHRYASVLPLQPTYALVSAVEPLDGWANLFPSRFRQLWLAILEPLFKSRPQERRMFGSDDQPAQDNFIFLGAGTFLPSDPAAGIDVDRRFNMSLLSLMNVRYLLSYYPLSSKYLVEIHAPANPLQKMSWDVPTGRLAFLRDSPDDRFGPVVAKHWPSLMQGLVSVIKGPPAAEDQVYAYRNVCALPRVFSVMRLTRHRSDQDVMKSMTGATTIELMQTAHVTDADAPPAAAQLAPASLRLLDYRGGQIELDAVAAGEAIIVFADSWLTGWKAYVDGQEIPPFRINHTQIGIHLPNSGRFHVRLSYEPPYRWLNDILAAPTKIVAGREAESRGHELSLGELPPVCASTRD
jgi:hypothetical protein